MEQATSQIVNRFSATKQPKKRNPHKGPYLTTLLLKLLKTKQFSTDDTVAQALKEAGLKNTKAVCLMLRYLYNGLEGDNVAIEGILERIDGRVNGKDNGKTNIDKIIFQDIKIEGQPFGNLLTDINNRLAQRVTK